MFCGALWAQRLASLGLVFGFYRVSVYVICNMVLFQFGFHCEQAMSLKSIVPLNILMPHF